GGGKALQVEIGDSSQDALSLHLEAGERAGRVVGADARRAEAPPDLVWGAGDEQQPAPGREQDQLFAGGGLDGGEVSADLDLSVEREVADDLRADARERARERRSERLGSTRGRREERQGHERIRSPAGSKKAPWVTRGPRS